MSLVLELLRTPIDDARRLIEELEAELSGAYTAEQRHGYSIERDFQQNPMNRTDIIGLIGLVFFVAGIGGGLERTLAAQSQAYQNLAAAGGGASPSVLAADLANATQFLRVGLLVAMFGAILLGIAVRGYLCAIVRGRPPTVE